MIGLLLLLKGSTKWRKFREKRREFKKMGLN
jgi:hypothetical protein